MSSEAHAALVGLAAGNTRMLRALCAFNQNPADYLDESRRPEFFPAEAPAALWQCARSRRHLSRHIASRVGAPSFDPHRAEWPLALLERPRLDRLARHVSAVLVGPRVRRTVSREEVLRWREWLTPEAHEFALKRAGLLPVNAPACGDAEGRSALELGHAWIAAATKGWLENIAARFALKLPAAASQGAAGIDGPSAARLVSSVLSTVESRWCSSFANMRT